MRALCCLALAAGCQAASVESQQQQAIVGGSIDVADSSVVAIVARRQRCEDNAPPIVCTGTVIAPYVVLTAAHCVPPGSERGSYEVYVGPTVGDPSGSFIAVDDAVRHPLFDDPSHAYDVGLVRLGEPASAAPIALPTAALDGSFVGATARIVGYGVTTVGQPADGNRRTGTMTIASVDPNTFSATPAPSNSCGGDSGGPVFVDTGGGEQLVGLTASGDATCTSSAIDSRVDRAIADFIQPYIAANSTSPGAAGRVPLDMACEAKCATGSDCPDAFACIGGHCQVADALAVTYGSSCSHDSECANHSCGRVWSDDCRCQTPCDAPPPKGGGSSCAVGGGDSAWIALALAFMGCRSRRRKRA